MRISPTHLQECGIHSAYQAIFVVISVKHWIASLRPANLGKPTSSVIDGELVYSIYRSRVVATYTAEKPLPHPDVLRHFTERAVRATVDALGFTNGCGYDVEIVQLVDNQDHCHWVFGVEEQCIVDLKVFDRLPAREVATLNRLPLGLYTQRCLGDLREAIRSPGDTAFFFATERLNA